MSYRCIVPICNNTVKNSGLNFHRFPQNEKLRESWIRACKLPDNISWNSSATRICSAHFTDDDKSTKGKIMGTNRLKPFVVPSLLVKKPPLESRRRKAQKLRRYRKDQRLLAKQQITDRKQLVDDLLKNAEVEAKATALEKKQQEIDAALEKKQEEFTAQWRRKEEERKIQALQAKALKKIARDAGSEASSPAPKNVGRIITIDGVVTASTSVVTPSTVVVIKPEGCPMPKVVKRGKRKGKAAPVSNKKVTFSPDVTVVTQSEPEDQEKSPEEENGDNDFTEAVSDEKGNNTVVAVDEVKGVGLSRKIKKIRVMPRISLPRKVTAAAKTCMTPEAVKPGPQAANPKRMESLQLLRQQNDFYRKQLAEAQASNIHLEKYLSSAEEIMKKAELVTPKQVVKLLDKKRLRWTAEDAAAAKAMMELSEECNNFLQAKRDNRLPGTQPTNTDLSDGPAPNFVFREWPREWLVQTDELEQVDLEIVDAARPVRKIAVVRAPARSPKRVSRRAVPVARSVITITSSPLNDIDSAEGDGNYQLPALD